MRQVIHGEFNGKHVCIRAKAAGRRYPEWHLGNEMCDNTLGGKFIERNSIAQMAGFHPHEPHWYIPLIGVDPIFQGQGYGTLLMRKD